MGQPSDLFSNTYRSSEETNCNRFEIVGKTPQSSHFKLQWKLQPGVYQPIDIRSQEDVFNLNCRLSGDIVKFPKMQGCVEQNISPLDERPETIPAKLDLLDTDYKDVMFSETQPDIVEGSRKPKVTVVDTKRRRRATSENWVPSKNLISERRRRQKLNESLYTLRALVPNITKMDKASILADTITHLQDLKAEMEALEKQQEGCKKADMDFNSREEVKSSCSCLTSVVTGIAGALSRDDSLDGSCSSFTDENLVHDLDFFAVLDPKVQEIQLAVLKVEDGLYKLTITCKNQTTVLSQLSEALEAFVTEIFYSNISATITSPRAICTFLVKMSTWNDMTLKAVEAHIVELVRPFGFGVLP